MIIYNKINNQCYEYINNNNNITININFLIVLCHKLKITKKIQMNNTFILKSNFNYYEIEKFNQMNEDILFINLFYNELEQIISFNNYENNFIIVQNFATFRNMYVSSEFLFQKFIDLMVSNCIIFFE